MQKTKWSRVGHRLEMCSDGSVIRQERDLTDFIGTDELSAHYGMKQFYSDDKYWYFCKDSYLIKMLEVVLGTRIF